MIDSIKKSFYIVRDFPVVSLPIIIYLFLVFIIFPLLRNTITNIGLLIFISAFTLLSIAFYTGWLFIIKKGIKLYNKDFADEEEKIYKSLSLIKKFFTGVGKYFLPILGQMVLYIVLLVAVGLLAHKIGTYFLPKLDFTQKEMQILVLQNEETIKFMKNLPTQKLFVLVEWLIYTSIIGLIFVFITMYWQASIFYSTQNPFMAFFKSVKFLFKHFLKSVGLMGFLIILHMILNILAPISVLHFILNFLIVLLSFYLFIYSTVLIFVYYEKENNSNNGTDSVG